MQVHVLHNGQQVGPLSQDQVVNQLRAGQFLESDLAWHQGCQDWIPLGVILTRLGVALNTSTPPPPPPPPVPAFGGAPGAVFTSLPVAGSERKADETIGMLMVFTPIVAAILAWFWVGSMNLLQDPSSKLGLLLAGTILGTAILAVIEANKLGMGSAADLAAWKQMPKDQRGGAFKPATPVVWFFGFIMIWIVSYPLYLYARCRYGAKNLLGAALASALIFCVGTGLVYSAIEAKKAEIRQTLSRY